RERQAGEDPHLPQGGHRAGRREEDRQDHPRRGPQGRQEPDPGRRDPRELEEPRRPAGGHRAAQGQAGRPRRRAAVSELPVTHPPHDERTPRMSTYVFGYGSLVSPASAARSLGRELTIDGLPSALLTGHRRDWGIGVPVEFDDGFRTVATFLDVQPREGSAVRGALLRVTDDELRILAAREAQYD